MKKILLLGIMLLGMGGVIHAEDVTSYEPDEEKTSIAAGDIVAIYNKADDKFLYGSGAQNLAYDVAGKAFVSSNSGWLFKVENITVDKKNYFLLRLITPANEEYNIWGKPGYLNTQPNGGVSFILGLNDQNGEDFANGAVWDIQYDATNNGFSLKNIGTGLYLNNAGAANNENPAYWTLCTLKEKTIENPIEKPTRTATDAKVIDLKDFTTISDGATWDAETKTFTKACGFQWTEGIDLSQYQYLAIVAGHNRDQADDVLVTIKDKNGVVIKGDDYGEPNLNMWMSTWNHLFCCKIDLEKLRQEKTLDIYHITELSIDGGNKFVISTVYASNTEPIVRKPWVQNEEGSFRITGKTADQFGTICLPYQAAVACAKVYEIADANSNGVGLKEVDGLMEAGKPYIYCTVENANPTAVTENKVFFYQTTDATVTAPVENNGLIGTFVDTTAPKGDDIYVLSGNKLYYTTDAEVTVGANKAYIDKTKIASTGVGAKTRIAFDATEATGIRALDAANALKGGKMYDLMGREVLNPAHGIYIVNGKKVVIK